MCTHVILFAALVFNKNIIFSIFLVWLQAICADILELGDCQAFSNLLKSLQVSNSLFPINGWKKTK